MRFIFLVRLRKLWRLKPKAALILPEEVRRKRFFAPDLVLSLGILRVLGFGLRFKSGWACPLAAPLGIEPSLI